MTRVSGPKYGNLIDFRLQGFVAIESLGPTDELGELRRLYDELFANRVGWEAGDMFDLAGLDSDDEPPALPQVLQPLKLQPAFAENSLIAAACGIFRSLFGPEARLTSSHAINKPAHGSAVTPWHQDAAYWSPGFAYPSVASVWIPLQEVDVDSGCMQFVPGSHNGQTVRRHRHIDDDPGIHGLELHPDERLRVTGTVACPIPTGGCTIHGGYTLHYSGPNKTAEPRRALVLVGGLAPVKLDVVKEMPWQSETDTRRLLRARHYQNTT